MQRRYSEYDQFRRVGSESEYADALARTGPSAHMHAFDLERGSKRRMLPDYHASIGYVSASPTASPVRVEPHQSASHPK